MPTIFLSSSEDGITKYTMGEIFFEGEYDFRSNVYMMDEKVFTHDQDGTIEFVSLEDLKLKERKFLSHADEERVLCQMAVTAYMHMNK